MPTERTRSRTAAGGRAAIIEMLKADHKKVKKAFREFQKLDPREDIDDCRAIVEQTLADIQVHATLEEELFYPAARECLREAVLIDEAEVEHATAKTLIEQLQHMNADEEKYAATFKVLGEYINHHVKEEEGEMFPQLSRAKYEWDSLLDQVQSRRIELEQEFMPHAAPIPDEDMEGVDVQSGAAPRRSSSTRGGARSKAAGTHAQAAEVEREDDE